MNFTQSETWTAESEALKAIDDATKDLLDDDDDDHDVEDRKVNDSDSESQPEGDGPLRDLIQSLEASKSQLRPPSERGSVKSENYWHDKSQKEIEQSPENLAPSPAEVVLQIFLYRVFL